MSDSEEIIPEKKGRGRPAAEKNDKARIRVRDCCLLLIECI